MVGAESSWMLLPPEVQEHVCNLLSTKDLLAISRALSTWTDESMRQLECRGGCAVTVVDQEVSLEAEEEEVEELLQLFLKEVAKSNPAVALIWVPKEVDKKRKLDIAKIFPPEVLVVKAQFRLLGFPWEPEGQLRVQALMMGRLGLSVGLLPILAREREDGQWQQVVLNGTGESDVEGGEEVDKLVGEKSSLALVLEVTQEMKTRESAFSRSKASAIYGPNYVTTSLLPAQYKSTTTIMQPLTPQRIRRELVNGFALLGSGINVTRQHLMHLLNWRRTVSELDLGEGVFSLVVVPRKVKGEMRRVVEEELVAKLPPNRLFLFTTNRIIIR